MFYRRSELIEVGHPPCAAVPAGVTHYEFVPGTEAPQPDDTDGSAYVTVANTVESDLDNRIAAARLGRRLRYPSVFKRANSLRRP